MSESINEKEHIAEVVIQVNGNNYQALIDLTNSLIDQKIIKKYDEDLYHAFFHFQDKDGDRIGIGTTVNDALTLRYSDDIIGPSEPLL